MVDQPAAYILEINGCFCGIVTTPCSREMMATGFKQTPLYRAPPDRRITELLEANNKLVEERRAIAKQLTDFALAIKATHRHGSEGYGHDECMEFAEAILNK